MAETEPSGNTPRAMPTQGHPPRGYPQWIFWVLAAAIILLVFTVLVQSVGGHSVSVQVVVGLVLIAALLTFLPRVTDVEKFVMNRGGMTLELAVQVASEAKAAAVGASERAEEAVSQADKATKEAEDARTKLDRFIFLSMPKPTYANLVKLAGPERFGPYNLNEGFVSQLRFLRDAGYIDVDRHVGELHGSDDLSRHVQVTELGREFIANRRRLVPNEQL